MIPLYPKYQPLKIIALWESGKNINALLKDDIGIISVLFENAKKFWGHNNDSLRREWKNVDGLHCRVYPRGKKFFYMGCAQTRREFERGTKPRVPKQLYYLVEKKVCEYCEKSPCVCVRLKGKGWGEPYAHLPKLKPNKKTAVASVFKA